jgi:hypothetical protein
MSKSSTVPAAVGLGAINLCLTAWSHASFIDKSSDMFTIDLRPRAPGSARRERLQEVVRAVQLLLPIDPTSTCCPIDRQVADRPSRQRDHLARCRHGELSDVASEVCLVGVAVFARDGGDRPTSGGAQRPHRTGETHQALVLGQRQAALTAPPSMR